MAKRFSRRALIRRGCLAIGGLVVGAAPSQTVADQEISEGARSSKRMPITRDIQRVNSAARSACSSRLPTSARLCRGRLFRRASFLQRERTLAERCCTAGIIAGRGAAACGSGSVAPIDPCEVDLGSAARIWAWRRPAGAGFRRALSATCRHRPHRQRRRPDRGNSRRSRANRARTAR